jgi:hypothetical protein
MPEHSADERRALSQAHSMPRRNSCGVCLRRNSTQDQPEAAAQAWRWSSFLVVARHPTCESSAKASASGVRREEQLASASLGACMFLTTKKWISLPLGKTLL